MTAATGSFATLEVADTGVCIFSAKLTAFSTGSVNFRVETSMDGTTFLDASARANIGSATFPNNSAVFNIVPTARYVRMSWDGTSTGTTAIVLYSCKR